MSTEGDFAICKNWYSCIMNNKNSGSSIGKDKVVLHESYCVKNLFRCKCGMVVEKRAKEQHDKDVHELVVCKYCSTKLEKGQLVTHEESCPKKPTICPYCTNEIKRSEFSKHVELCGNRTVLCPKCKNYVPKKEWTDHQKVPCAPEESEQKKELFDSPGIVPKKSATKPGVKSGLVFHSKHHKLG